MDSETLGIIVGLAVGVAVAVFVVLRIVRKKRNAEDQRTSEK